ncbi:MAG TPA: LuxR C-terminal-related transcriptional regulator, partial [Limnochorda sp.]
AVQSLISGARRLFDADINYLKVRSPASGEYFVWKEAGLRSDRLKAARSRYPRGLISYVLATQQAVASQDYFADRRFRHEVDDVMAEEGVISMLAAPICSPKGKIGCFYVAYRDRQVFFSEDLQVLSILANVASTVLARQYPVPAGAVGSRAGRGLSRRQVQVLTGLMAGKTVEEIAHDLRISVHTVRFHLKELMRRTGARGQKELLIWAFTHLAHPRDQASR